MKFFEKRRVSTYIHGGKFRNDAKSGMRYWVLNLVITLTPADVQACGDAIVSNYQQIECVENRVEEIKINVLMDEHVIEFFGLSDHKAPMLVLGRCALSELKMTKADGLCELWVKAEHECTDALHGFVREYAFQRLWCEFAPRQTALPVTVVADEKPKTPGPRVM